MNANYQESGDKVGLKPEKSAWTRWIFLALAVLMVAGTCICLGWVFFAFSGCPDTNHKAEFLADFGEFFGLASAIFTGFAFIGVSATIPFLIAQAKAARDQVKQAISQVEAANQQIAISNRQAELADQTNKDASRQALFVALSQRVGEVISDPEIGKLPAIREAPVNGSFSFKETVNGQLEYKVFGMADDEFLQFASQSLELGVGTSQAIPQHDRFRRQSLFRALRSLLSGSTGFQRQLFIDALNAQIHDKAARMLMIKSLVELDRETLQTYAWLGMKFDVLNEFPILVNELKRRFPESIFDPPVSPASNRK